MELSNEISFGLKRLANTSLVSDEHFERLINETIEYLENPLGNHRSFGIENATPRVDVLKESYASLMSVFVESARTNIDTETFKSVLLDHRLSESRVEKILDVFVKYKFELQNALKKFNSDPPKLLGVSWKLNYCVKSSFSDFDGKCLYFIELQVDKNNCLESKNPEVIKFVCTVQQLQSLVASLRAAVRQLDVIANFSKQ